MLPMPSEQVNRRIHHRQSFYCIACSTYPAVEPAAYSTRKWCDTVTSSGVKKAVMCINGHLLEKIRLRIP